MKIIIRLQFDGSHYAGFQSQKNGTSIQEALSAGVNELFGFPCDLTGCSRTDAGVHALAFCATIAPKKGVFVSPPMPVDKIPIALNHHLPDDISVTGAAIVDDDFHPRYNVVSKTYIYIMSDSLFPSPFDDGRICHLRHPMTDRQIELMNLAAQHIVGTHDFTSFMANGSKITDCTRTVFDCRVTRSAPTEFSQRGNLVLKITADGFLYNMVRIIAGTLTDIGYGSIKLPMDEIISSRDRAKAGRTAPAYGLYLYDVKYDRDIEFLH